MTSTQDFLDLIHGSDAVIYFQVASKTWKNKPQTFRQAEAKLRWRNAQGDDVCFIVNTGGTRDAQINRINAVFVDWDCGRDQDGHYFSDDEARSRKDAFLPSLLNFIPAASIIVETRNGFHAYWLMNLGVTPHQFRECQKRLTAQFHGDEVVINPARVMRLPGFDWVKPSSGYSRFPVNVLRFSETRYSVENVLDALPELKNEVEDSSGRISAHNKCECISTLALIVGPKPASTEQVAFSSVSEALDYLKKQDLKEYLIDTGGTPDGGERMACPFHADANPSAGVFPGGTAGHWIFKCHVCGITGTIIDMAMRRHGCTKGTAIKLLFTEYNIRIETGWKTEQRDKLQRNLAVIDDMERLRELYPCLYRLIGRVRHDLESKIKMAQEFLVSERSQVAGQAVFFSSLRNFHRAARGELESPKYCNRQNEKVDRYCLLGLLRKLPDAQVPPVLLGDAMERKLSLGRKFRIQFFVFPDYTPEVLEEANKRACKLIAAGVSVRGISPELIGDLFGMDVVRDVYPQLGDPEQTVSQAAFRAAVEAALMSAVEGKGYATTRELRAAMGRHDEWRSVTVRRIEKCLPGILLRSKLTKRTCNQQLKKLLGIGGAGYPRIIVPKIVESGRGNQSCL